MDFAKKQAQRGGRNKIILISLLLVFAFAVSGGVLLDAKPFAAAGVFTDAKDLENLYNAGDTWVTGQVSSLFFTDYSYSTYEEGRREATEKVTAWYHAFDANPDGVDPIFVLVKMPAKYQEEDYIDFVITGTVRRPETDERVTVYGGIASDWASQLGEEYTRYDVEAFFSPYLIDMTQTRLDPQIWSCVMLAVGLFSIFLLIRTISTMRNYADSKAFLRLGGGDPEKAELANNQISAEYENPVLILNKTARLTENWIVQTNAFGYKVFPKTALLWMYQHVLQQRTYGIPSGKTFSVILRFTDTKATMQLPAKNEKAAIALMEQIIAYKPDMLVGYNAEANAAYAQLAAEQTTKE